MFVREFFQLALDVGAKIIVYRRQSIVSRLNSCQMIGPRRAPEQSRQPRSQDVVSDGRQPLQLVEQPRDSFENDGPFTFSILGQWIRVGRGRSTPKSSDRPDDGLP